MYQVLMRLDDKTNSFQVLKPANQLHAQRELMRLLPPRLLASVFPCPWTERQNLLPVLPRLHTNLLPDQLRLRLPASL